MSSDDSGLEPELFGLNESNSSRIGEDLWGKNQFNATFPVALCLYMQKQELKPVSVMLKSKKIVTCENEYQVKDFLGDPDQESVRYNFEEVYKPYTKLMGKEDKIDLVVDIDGEPHTPIEIKLTVTPDITTAPHTFIQLFTDNTSVT